MPDFDNPFETLVDFIALVREGDWRLVTGFVLMAAMLGLNKVRGRVSFFRGDRGGAILVLVLALAGSISAALFSDAGLDASLIVGAVSTAFTAAGGYTLIKRIIWPKDKAPVE